MMHHALVVAGLGRCGSTLAMQMLHAAGVPTAGRWWDFEKGEPEHYALKGITAADWPELRGRAVKVLASPLTTTIERPVDVPIRVVWLTRDHEEQVKSQAKYLVAKAGFAPLTAAQRKALEASNRAQEIKLVRIWKDLGAMVTFLPYERLIKDPKNAAVALCVCAGLEGQFHIAIPAMCAAVLKSDPTCAPDMAMEERFAAAARAVA